MRLSNAILFICFKTQILNLVISGSFGLFKSLIAIATKYI